MRHARSPMLLAAALTLVALPVRVHAQAAESSAAAIAKARADSARLPYTTADIAFMTHMIGHHAQAILISGWAASHGANPSIQTLASRIINAQHDEIATMQRWLRDRRQPVPGGKAATMDEMPGMTMPLMPGMLSATQLQALDSARGIDFDQLFLRDMIQHHKGATQMVRDLFASYGAAQDEQIFKYASDINVDQTTEIARMEKMLATEIFGASAH